MSDRKFTDDEVIKALERCIQSESCECCEYREKTNKVDVCTIKQDALALINQQKAEIYERTIDMNAARLGMIAEHERLKTAKTEAIKEFADRLCEGRVSNDAVVIAAKCLLKEMTEGGEPRKDVGK